MLTTFVIALREGLEASLIVGIIAAFLKRQGRPDALRSMWVGVGLAVAVCVAVAVVLRIVDNELPQREQEGLETIVALVAVAMVTYMIVWMTEHARDLKGQLQEQAAGALVQGSATALVAMAFLAVLREGFETSVFLLAAFNDAADPVPGGPRRRSRPRRRRCARLRDLPRRRAPEPLALLPRHRRGPRARGRGPRRLLAAHGGRGRLGRRRPEPGARPQRDHPPGHGLGVAHHRHPRHPRAADGDRGRGLAALRHPDAGDRPRARRRAPARARDGGRAPPSWRPRSSCSSARSAAARRPRAAVASSGAGAADRQRGDHRRGLRPGGAEARLRPGHLRRHQQGRLARDRVRGRPGQPRPWRRSRTSPTG